MLKENGEWILANVPEERLSAIKSRIELLRLEQARHEALADQARASAAQAVQELRQTFGVTSMEDAQTMLVTLTTQLGETLVSIEERLANAG